MSYRCPVCGEPDEHAYLRCYHPGCPDGRDQGRSPFQSYHPMERPPVSHRVRRITYTAIVAALLLLLSWWIRG